MTRRYRLSTITTWMLAACCVLLVSNAGPVRAGDVSQQQIIDQLAQPRTRSLTAPAQDPNDRKLIESLQHRTRSLTYSERTKIATIAKTSPKIDLQIHFDFDSAAITPKAEPQLEQLGQALSGSELNGATILLGGHTDAKGSDDYNQELSERRAEAVRRYLIDKFHIPGQNLTAVGYGKQDLANKDDPYAAENRRVMIVNLASKQQANR
jgi:outer membrane protein OmpA-like peptidoglycan-associated protein